MAVKSKADKTGGHKTSAKRVYPAYSSAPVPPHAAPVSQSKGAGQISPSGQKALMFRARKELAPVADPNSPITE